jgi:Flp pilus assembly pilin Flp
MRNLALHAYTWAQARKPRFAREEGQGVIEYALVVALVSVVLAALLVGFGTGLINSAKDKVDTALGGS